MRLFDSSEKVWSSFWAQSKKSVPSMIVLSIEEEGGKEKAIEFAYFLPKRERELFLK